MAHALLEAAREGSKGPVAAAGAIIGVLLVLVLGLTVFAPPECVVSLGSPALEGLIYFCLNEAPPQLELGGFSYAGPQAPHTLPWLSIGFGGVAGSIYLTWLLGRE